MKLTVTKITLHIVQCIILLLLIIFGSVTIQAQNINLNKSPRRTYVFKISDKEAEKLVKSGTYDTLVMSMLHTPVASFTKKWDGCPESGHFIFANIYENKVTCRYAPVMPFQVFLYKEYGMLTMQIVDNKGNIRDDAKIRIKARRRFFDSHIDFDKASKTYTIKDESEKSQRLMTVELNKFKVTFDLSKHFVNPWYGNYGGASDHSPEFYGYMITDKNKYKPGETVRFKSYALSERKSPLKKDLEVWMRMPDYRYKKITNVSPYHPGGFAGEIQLHDSLKLRLDHSYNIQLRNNKGRIVAQTNFSYQDYELYDSKLEVSLRSPIQYYPDNNKIEIKATDANGLLLQDMKANILIKRRNVLNSYTDFLTVPDTLFFKRIDLSNTEPTVINISPDLFGEADGTYDVYVTAVTFDNQPMHQIRSAAFYRSHHSLSHELKNDTIRFEFFNLGKAKKAKALLSLNNSEETKEIELPYSEVFTQSVENYTIDIIEPKKTYTIPSRYIHTKLDVTGGISADSFNVKLINPAKLDVTWYLYQGNLLLEKGSGKEFDFKYPNTDLGMTHYVELFYFLGKEEQVFRRTFVPKTEYLSIDIDLPERIFPGQTTDVTVSVKDNLGKPVKDVDLTAFSVNSLMNHYVPDLPYYGKQPLTREQRESYSLNKKLHTHSATLNYDFWNKIARLDTLTYYQFTYPINKMFTYTVNAPDSTTQFAPFVMKDGNAVHIYVIEMDGAPIYFSWTEQPKGFSFSATDTAYHKIALRLHDRAIILDSLCFDKGKKTIISVDMDRLPKKARVVMLDNGYGTSYLTSQETSLYKHYISRIPIEKNDFTYMKQGKNIYPVFHPCLSSFRPSVLIGPFPQGKAQYTSGDSTKIEYKHEGGFSYAYDENVVYKYQTSVFPDRLTFSSSNVFSQLNDFCLTQTVFKDLMKECNKETSKWFPQNITIMQNGMNMTFRLPAEKDSTGVSNLLFRSHETGKILFPDQFEYGTRKYSSIPQGTYDIILLYNNGKYLKYENASFRANTYIEVKMFGSILYEADPESMKWLALRTYSREAEIRKPVTTNQTQSTTYQPGGVYESFYTKPSVAGNAKNLVKGTILDEIGEPLIGVSVQIKGTTYGTVSDLDGNFEIAVQGAENTLIFNYVGFKRQEINVKQGSEITVTLTEDSQLLEEVVVVGYGTYRKQSITGAVSAVSEAGVTESPAPQSPPENAEDTETNKTEPDKAEEQLYNELLQLNGLRSNFSDVGFWEPRLYTDRKGQASFKITFPDNITRWDAVVYAMNRKLKTGTFRKSIKSYKPLMAELKTPQFLVVGDSSLFSGNIRNYTKDKEIFGKLEFVIQQDTIMNESILFTSSRQDKLPVVAEGSDSISVTYLFSRNDGYKDGELRTIPIERQGTEIAEGTLSFLRNGDNLSVKTEKDESVHVRITGKQLDVYMDATYYLTGYKYACNEQLASKLVGLLNYKIYSKYTGEEFKHDKNIREIVKRLVDNRNDQKLWSWWGRSSSSSYWMSAHILRALKMAKDAGYVVNLDLQTTEQDYSDTRTYRHSSLYDIEILHALSEWGTQQNYEKAVDMFEKEISRLETYEDSLVRKKVIYSRNSYLKEKLLLWEIKQKQHIGYASDSISKYLKKDVLGAVYCDDGMKRYWYSDNLATTLIAYRIVKNDSSLVQLKEPMQMYILGTKQYGWNTYQAASAVSTVLPDLLTESFNKERPATVILSGKENTELTRFPYETELMPGEQLNISKQDGMPLIYTSYSMKRVINERSGDAFEISSYLSGGDTLTAGKTTSLIVKLNVKQKNAEHVMIEVPIPAGCSYASKNNYYYGTETHREYFKEKTVIFCERLPEGTHHFTISLLPRYSGKYILNPAKAEMMYFPIINANNDMRNVSIGERSE